MYAVPGGQAANLDVVKMRQQSDFVGMQLVPHHVRQLLALGSASQAQAGAVQTWVGCLLQELGAGGANQLKQGQSGGMAGNVQHQQTHQQHLQHQQQYQQAQPQHQLQQQQQQPYPQYQPQQYQAQQQYPQYNMQHNPNAPHRENPRRAPAKSYSRCDLARAQAVFDPLVERAMSLHNDAMGQEGVAKGLRELYEKLKDGSLSGSVENDVAQLVEAMEVRDLAKATQMRDKIVRTTTTGWVQGGTWQWSLKHLIVAARG
eukprot:TRINITY_DN37660_c0_g1_i1.p1 TRINITY_DN37660_c0_g1~~TRINITY_DN37660_c0_g1_i1.p1  ORF type:complete len:259 (+),score=53.02 TRINITY_DN37660_c0_g1_i1:77-853(+)